MKETHNLFVSDVTQQALPVVLINQEVSKLAQRLLVLSERNDRVLEDVLKGRRTLCQLQPCTTTGLSDQLRHGVVFVGLLQVIKREVSVGAGSCGQIEVDEPVVCCWISKRPALYQM